MAHFVTLADAARNDMFDVAGQFTANRLPGHVCVPECHEIGREPEREVWASIRSDDGSGERCVECGGPHFDCTDPANWDDDDD
jgi:hypothetical protein